MLTIVKLIIHILIKNISYKVNNFISSLVVTKRYIFSLTKE